MTAHTGFVLATTTVAEVLKDVIPNYKIAETVEDSREEGVLLKKDTMKLQKYESKLLEACKSFLVRLEPLVNANKKKNKSTRRSIHALNCACSLVVAHPHFNYANNVIQLIVPLLESPSLEVREKVRETLGQLLKADKKGETSLHAVKCIKNVAVKRKYRIRPDLIRAFMDLPQQALAGSLVAEMERLEKKREEKDKPVSKKEKKRQKAMKRLESEMLEAKGEENRVVRNRNFTEVSKVLFHVVFTILKDVNVREELLVPAMQVISKYAGCINIDFLYDVLINLAGMVKREDLGLDLRLQSLKTALDILNGPGSAMSYDTQGFVRPFLTSMLVGLDLNSAEVSDKSLGSVAFNLAVKRKKSVSRDVVASLAKSMSTTLLQFEETASFLQSLKQIRVAHPRVFEDLLESEGFIFQNLSELHQEFKCNKSCTMWELHMLRKHIDPQAREEGGALLKP